MNIILKIFILEVGNFITIVSTIVGSLFTGGVGAWYLALKKQKKTLPSDVNKTDAEAEKIKAEAGQIKVAADVTLVDTAIKVASLLREECDMTKTQLKDTETRLYKAQDELADVKNSLNDALRKIDSLELNLNEERKKNADMSDKNILMTNQIAKLQEELQNLKK